MPEYQFKCEHTARLTRERCAQPASYTINAASSTARVNTCAAHLHEFVDYFLFDAVTVEVRDFLQPVQDPTKGAPDG